MVAPELGAVIGCTLKILPRGNFWLSHAHLVESEFLEGIFVFLQYLGMICAIIRHIIGNRERVVHKVSLVRPVARNGANDSPRPARLCLFR